MDMATLKNELITDPTDRGYADMSDAGAAASLMASDIATTQPISSSVLLAWAAQAGRFVKISNAATSESDTLASLARAALLLVQRDGTSLDLSNDQHAAMLDALVSAGVLTTDDKTSLITLAATTTSRSAQLGLGRVLKYHVTKARAI